MSPSINSGAATLHKTKKSVVAPFMGHRRLDESSNYICKKMSRVGQGHALTVNAALL